MDNTIKVYKEEKELREKRLAAYAEAIREKVENDSEQVIEKDGMKKVIVNFERPTENGFDSARCELPDYKWTERIGYSDEEIAMFDELLHNNAHLLYKYAENGSRFCNR